MGLKGVGDLLHKAAALENVECFLFSLPVIGADNGKVLPPMPCHPERFMPVSYLFYKGIQVVPECACADPVHVFAFG